MIDALVQELAQAGALDAGSADTFGPLIEAWRRQHHQIVQVKHLDNVQARDERAVELQARIEEARLRVAAAERRLLWHDERLKLAKLRLNRRATASTDQSDADPDADPDADEEVAL